MIFKVPLSGGGLILPLPFPQALSREFRVHWRGGRTDGPQMESRPYEFLLQLLLYLFNIFTATLNFCENLVNILGLLL